MPFHRAANENATLVVSAWRVSTSLLWVALSIGLVPVAGALAQESVWGAEPTLGLMLSIAAAVGLGRHYADAGRSRVQYRSARQRRGAP